MQSKKMTPLGQFIAEEMARRGLSQNEFARLVGVNSSTLGKAMRFEGVPEPTLDFLRKLAEATNTDVCLLVRLALHESEADSRSARAELITSRILSLTPAEQDIVDQMLGGLHPREGR